MADLLLYDRLVIPVPSADDVARWEEHWDPERQARLLEILGGFAEPVEWNTVLRRDFWRKWSTRHFAHEIDFMNMVERERAARYSFSRGTLADHLAKQILNEQGDVRGVAVYAQPDRFDREWELTGTPPFLRRVTRIRPGMLREVVGLASGDQRDLAKVVISRLVVPDEGKTDEEVLKRTVDLVSHAEVPERRAAFHALLASLDAEGLRDDTIVGELEDLLNAFNESIRRHSTAWRMRIAVQFVTTGRASPHSGHHP